MIRGAVVFDPTLPCDFFAVLRRWAHEWILDDLLVELRRPWRRRRRAHEWILDQLALAGLLPLWRHLLARYLLILAHHLLKRDRLQRHQSLLRDKSSWRSAW